MALQSFLSLPRVPIIVFAIVTVVALFVFRAVFRALTSPLRSVPGPFEARFSRLWYLRQVWAGNWTQTEIELHKKYGPIVRITPYEYSIDDPEAVKPIYGHGTQFIKSPWYYASAPLGSKHEGLFTDTNIHNHATNRRKVASLYSTSNLLQMEVCIVECTDAIVKKFEQFAKSNTVFDMQNWMQRYAFDLIALITLSKRFGFLSGEDTTELFAALHSYLTYATHVGIYPEWHKILQRVLSLLPTPRGLEWMSRFVQNNIQTRMKTEEKPGAPSPDDDFLTKALRLHSDDPNHFELEEVFMTCLTNIGAGSDTTSVSLSSIMLGLIKYPETYSKLREEIDEKARTGAASRPVTFQEAQKMPYLQACIKEGLRMHPATGLPLGRVVPKGGATISGVFFPSGNVVGINTWVAHSNTDVFGRDADVFRPDRWLEDKEKARQMEKYWLPFGHGSRTCIGKNISLLEISKIVPELVRNFDFTIMDGQNIRNQNLWFVTQKNFKCRVSIRNELKLV